MCSCAAVFEYKQWVQQCSSFHAEFHVADELHEFYKFFARARPGVHYSLLKISRPNTKGQALNNTSW